MLWSLSVALIFDLFVGFLRFYPGLFLRVSCCLFVGCFVM